jgi:hypothetical protein
MKNKINYLILLISIILPAFCYSQSTARIVEGDIFPGIFSENNYLVNFGAEKNVTTGVSSTMTVARITSGNLLLHGLGSFQITPTANGQTFSVSATAMMPRLIGANCQASLDYTTTSGTTTNYFASVLSGTTTLASQTLTAVSGTAKTADLFFPCPSQLNVTAATPQVSLRVTAINSALTQSLVLDKLYLGKAYSGQSVTAYRYQAPTTSYTAVVGDYISVSGTSLVVSMPTAVSNIGKTVFITNVSTSSTSLVSVTTTVPSQLIGGVTSATNVLRNETLSLISDGSNWQFLDADKMERTYRVLFGGAGTRFTSCTSSPCVIWSDSGGTVSVTRNSTGNYYINLIAGLFSQVPVCTATWNGGGTIFATASVDTTIRITITAFNTGSPADGAFNVICKGPR